MTLLQRGTMVWLAIALGLGGYSSYLAVQRRTQQPTATETTSEQARLFDFTESQIASIEIRRPEQSPLVFQQESVATMQQWQMLTPEKKPASRGAVSFLTNLLTQYQGADPFEVTSEQLVEYGFNGETTTVEIRLVDGTSRVLTFGELNFDQTKIYGRVGTELQVWILPLDFLNSVTRDLQEWTQIESTTDIFT
ncbi:MAG: DUF4340 domain-containing protein [Limnothrix sp.]